VNRTHSHQIGVNSIANRARMPSAGWSSSAPASWPIAPVKTRSKNSSSQLAGRPVPLVAAGGPQWRRAEPGRAQRDAGEPDDP
jgi:hypothetical protein